MIISFPRDGKTSLKARDNRDFDSGPPDQWVTGDYGGGRAQVLSAARPPQRCKWCRPFCKEKAAWYSGLFPVSDKGQR